MHRLYCAPIYLIPTLHNSRKAGSRDPPFLSPAAAAAAIMIISANLATVLPGPGNQNENRRPNNPKPTVYQPGAGLMSPERALTLLRHFEVNLLAPEFRHCPRPAPGQSRRRRAEHSGSSSADPGLQKSSTWNAESWDAQEQNQLPNRPELQHQDHSHCSQPHLEGCQRSLASVLVLHIGVKHDAQPTVGSCLGLGPVLQTAE